MTKNTAYKTLTDVSKNRPTAAFSTNVIEIRLSVFDQIGKDTYCIHEFAVVLIVYKKAMCPI